MAAQQNNLTNYLLRSFVSKRGLLQGRIKVCKLTTFPVVVDQGLMRLANYRVSSSLQRKLSLVNDGGMRSLQYISRATSCKVKFSARRVLKSSCSQQEPTTSNTKWEYSFEINDGGDGVYIRSFDSETLATMDPDDPQTSHIDSLEGIQKRIGTFMNTLDYTSINTPKFDPEAEFSLTCKNGYIFLEDYDAEGYLVQIKSFAQMRCWAFVLLPNLQSVFHYKLRAVFKPIGDTFKHDCSKAFISFYTEHMTQILSCLQDLQDDASSQTAFDVDYIKFCFWMLKEIYRLILKPISTDIATIDVKKLQTKFEQVHGNKGHELDGSEESDGWSVEEENKPAKKAEKVVSPKTVFKNEKAILALAQFVEENYNEDLKISELRQFSKSVFERCCDQSEPVNFLKRHHSTAKFVEAIKNLATATIFESRLSKIQTHVLENCPPFDTSYPKKIINSSHKYFCERPNESQPPIRTEAELHRELFELARADLLTLATPEYVTATLRRGRLTDYVLDTQMRVRRSGYDISVLTSAVEFKPVDREMKPKTLQFPQGSRIFNFRYLPRCLLFHVEMDEEDEDSEDEGMEPAGREDKVKEAIHHIRLDNLQEWEGDQVPNSRLMHFSEGLANTDLDCYGDNYVACVEPLSTDPIMVHMFKEQEDPNPPKLVISAPFSELVSVPESMLQEFIEYENQNQVSSSMQEFDTGATSISVCFETITKLHADFLFCALYDYENDDKNCRMWFGLHKIKEGKSPSKDHLNTPCFSTMEVPKEALGLSKICIPGFLRVVKSNTFFWLTISPSLDIMLQVVRHHTLQLLQPFRLGKRLRQCLRWRVPPMTQVHVTHATDKPYMAVTLEQEMIGWQDTRQPPHPAVYFLLKL